MIEAVVLAYGSDHYARVVDALVHDGMAATAITVVQNPRFEGEAPIPVKPAGIRVIPMATNGGYGTAMNVALAAPRSPATAWMLLLTHDVELDPGAIAALTRAAGRADGFGILAPVLRWNGDHAVYDRTYGGTWNARDGSVEHLETPAPAQPAGISPCDWADGSVLLLRREAIAESGPFDDVFFLYFEETELCLRLAAAGWKAGCVLDAQCAQEPGTQRRPGAYAYLLTRNAVEFARRVGGHRAAARAAASAVRRLPLRRLLRASTTPGARIAAAQSAFGALAGLAAYTLRRFGPPPARLPGIGDVRVLGGAPSADTN